MGRQEQPQSLLVTHFGILLRLRPLALNVPFKEAQSRVSEHPIFNVTTVAPDLDLRLSNRKVFVKRTAETAVDIIIIPSSGRFQRLWRKILNRMTLAGLRSVKNDVSLVAELRRDPSLHEACMFELFELGHVVMTLTRNEVISIGRPGRSR